MKKKRKRYTEQFKAEVMRAVETRYLLAVARRDGVIVVAQGAVHERDGVAAAG